MIFRRALLAGVLVVTLTLAMGCQSMAEDTYPTHTPTSISFLSTWTSIVPPSSTPTVITTTPTPPFPPTTTPVIISPTEDTQPVEIAEPVAAVREAWQGSGSIYLALCIAEEESEFNPYAIGSSGEVSIFQLHPYGVLPHFWAWGGSDYHDSWEVARFVREYTDENGWGAWESTLAECR